MTRTLLISGASRGIGRAIAERALAEGHRLSLGVRRPANLEGSPLAPSASVLVHPYEATDPASAGTWVEASAAHFGSLDGVIHCAGIFSRAGLLFDSSEAADIDQVLQVNLMGPWWLTRSIWPHLEASGDGRVIAVVSMSGKRVKGNLAAYAASKFALLGLCQSMRNLGWPLGIRVTALCPGWVNTAMAAGVQTIPSEAMTQSEDLATLVSTLLSLPKEAVPFELAVNCVLEI